MNSVSASFRFSFTATIPGTTPPSPAAGSAGSIPAPVLSELHNHGFDSPIRGISDPRLQYPELLLLDGWEREDPPPGCAFAYQCSGDESTDGGQRWQQTYMAGKDGGCILTTRCGHTETVIRKDPQGRVNTAYRTI